ncbi:tripartite tricarboxylate transporter substrate binding protein [Parapusillimonas sp. SGNA-6]|nr:tripartite tricarboxylate transporter substrate binding protein [Parapusillimonas sp. SGNA-6]
MRAALACIAALIMATAQIATAKEVVKLIVPTAPGGGTDVLFRAISRYVEPQLDATVVILNVSGAGGTIGVSELTRAKPDGRTLAGVWMGPITVAPHTVKTTYGLDDYIPVIQLDSAPYVLCVLNDFPAKDGKGFIEELRRNPDKYTYGTDGVAGPGQLAVERVFEALGVSARDIPYKGAGETMPALLGHVVDIYSGSVPLGVNLEKSGDGKCLLATSAKRIAALPDAISLEELGIPDRETLLWHGIIAPKGTPEKEVIAIQDAFEKAANSPEMTEFFQTAGVEKSIIKGAEFRKRIDDEYAALGKLVVSLGLKPAK